MHSLDRRVKVLRHENLAISRPKNLATLFTVFYCMNSAYRNQPCGVKSIIEIILHLKVLSTSSSHRKSPITFEPVDHKKNSSDAFPCEALQAKLNKSIRQNFEIYDKDNIPELDM